MGRYRDCDAYAVGLATHRGGTGRPKCGERSTHRVIQGSYNDGWFCCDVHLPRVSEELASDLPGTDVTMDVYELTVEELPSGRLSTARMRLIARIKGK